MTKTILKGETDRATSADVSVADPGATVALTVKQAQKRGQILID